MIKKGLSMIIISYILSWACFAISSPFFNSHSQIAQAKDCENYERKEDIIILDPQCILDKTLPKLSLQDKVDAVEKRIKNIKNIYNPNKSFITYKESTITLKGKNLYPLDSTFRNMMLNLKKNHEKAEIPIEAFAPYVIDSLAIYATDKDISMLLPCTKQNYLLAFENLDNKIIKPGEQFNFNKYLVYLYGYCAGETEGELLFYWGVCWVASQIFRTALMMPNMTIPVRRNHGEWFSVYYGDKIQWDDAAVFETSKKLIIENTSDTDIIMKTFQEGNRTYLMFITDKKAVENKRVEIKKEYPNPYKVILYKSIYKKEKKQNQWSYFFSSMLPFLFKNDSYNTKLLNEEEFVSKYTGINSENR